MASVSRSRACPIAASSMPRVKVAKSASAGICQKAAGAGPLRSGCATARRPSTEVVPESESVAISVALDSARVRSRVRPSTSEAKSAASPAEATTRSRAHDARKEPPRTDPSITPARRFPCAMVSLSGPSRTSMCRSAVAAVRGAVRVSQGPSAATSALPSPHTMRTGASPEEAASSQTRAWSSSSPLPLPLPLPGAGLPSSSSSSSALAAALCVGLPSPTMRVVPLSPGTSL